MPNDRLHLMGDFNDRFDEVRANLYRLLEFEESDWSEKKDLAKREVLYGLNEIRISVENL